MKILASLILVCLFSQARADTLVTIDTAPYITTIAGRDSIEFVVAMDWSNLKTKPSTYRVTIEYFKGNLSDATQYNAVNCTGTDAVVNVIDSPFLSAGVWYFRIIVTLTYPFGIETQYETFLWWTTTSDGMGGFSDLQYVAP